MQNAVLITSFDMTAQRCRARRRFTVGHASRACGKATSDDFFGVSQPRDDDSAARRGTVLAIADGLGGTGGGRVAAEAAVRSVLIDYYATPDEWPIPFALDKVLSAINTWLYSHNDPKSGGGLVTTLSLLALTDDEYFLAHIGDSRIVRLRDGEVEQLTTDHVWPLKDMQRTLKRGVGLDSHLVVDYTSGELRAGDVFALVSDGVWEVLGDREFGEIVKLHADPQPAADALVTRSVVQQLKYYGRNDATALVVRVEGTDPAL